jgi:hypothetical protein
MSPDIIIASDPIKSLQYHFDYSMDLWITGASASQEWPEACQNRPILSFRVYKFIWLTNHGIQHFTGFIRVVYYFFMPSVNKIAYDKFV